MSHLDEFLARFSSVDGNSEGVKADAEPADRPEPAKGRRRLWRSR